ncbi:MAG: hypothetical protein HRU15_02775 [Planctomycetes bacterium]|nr:hypothetical protein [Planctomycetota bacterium]
MFSIMKVYLQMLLLLVVIAHTGSHGGQCLGASELVPNQPAMISSGPVITLPPHYDYATRLLHLYNAQVDNPNFRIPRIAEIMDDSKRGLQAWLSCLPDAMIFSQQNGYPIYRSSGDINGQNETFVLFLPNSQGTLIEQHIQERLQRFIIYQCLADGFPRPQIGKVQASDYSMRQGDSVDTWLTPLCAGILAAISILLLLSLRRTKTT